MHKAFTLLFLTLTCNTLIAKVAYIPLFDAQDINDIRQDSLMVVDLEEGTHLKTILVGEGVGAVFINAFGDKLFASAEVNNKIVLIDTSTLEIVYEWTNLAIKPQQIILNKTEDRLYFSENNHDSIYQIDLTNNQVSIALQVSGLERFWYSENLDYIAIKTYDQTLDTYKLLTYNLNSLNLKYEREFDNIHRIFLGENGERFYYPLFSPSRLYSYNLDTSTTNWYFFYEYAPSGGLGLFTDNFANVFEKSQTKLTVVGWHGTYEIDKYTGVGERVSLLFNTNNPYTRIDEDRFLKSNRPQTPFCGIPAPGQDCHNYLPLQLTIQNHRANNEDLVFQRDRAGSLASGRYIGEKRYAVPIIPVLNKPSLLIFLLCLFLLLTYLTVYKIRHQIN